MKSRPISWFIVFLSLFLSFSLNQANTSDFSHESSCPEPVIVPKYQFEVRSNFSHHNPLLWGKEDLTYFRNSPHLTEFIRNNYPSEWSHPVVFAVIADEKYIHSLELLLETFSYFKISQNDVLAVSISESTTTKLSAKGIRSFSYGKPSLCAEDNTRCIVSLAKFNTVIDLLQSSYSVFFLDLDVFFKRFPLPLYVNSSIDIYSQTDSAKLSSFNFGCFFVQPNKRTINLFQSMKDQFVQHPRTWDQVIYNSSIFHSAAHYEFFGVKEYLPLHVLSRVALKERELHSLIAAHTTCIEGSWNKFLLGRVIFQGFATPNFYHKCHRVISFSIKPDYSYQAFLNLIKIVIQASQHLRRPRIRLIGWEYFHGKLSQGIGNFKVLYDPDRLFFDWNITLVEEDYWKNLKDFHAKSVFTSSYLTLTSNYVKELQECGYTHEGERVDDLILSIDDEALYGANVLSDGKDYSNLICKHHNDNSTHCLHTCSGSHF